MDVPATTAGVLFFALTVAVMARDIHRSAGVEGAAGRGGARQLPSRTATPPSATDRDLSEGVPAAPDADGPSSPPETLTSPHAGRAGHQPVAPWIGPPAGGSPYRTPT